MAQDKNVQRVLPYTKEWEVKANRLARDYVPAIYPCYQCGNPVVSGYVCTYCGNVNPTGTAEERAEYNEWVFQKIKK